MISGQSPQIERFAPGRSLATAFVAAIIFLCAPLVWSPFAHLDFLWLDALTARQSEQSHGDKDIVIIDIDDYSLQTLASTLGRWPWPRASYAELVEWLNVQGVRAIVFDIWFSEPDIFRPEFDQYFGEVLAKYHNVYLPTLIMNSADINNARRLDSYPNNLPIIRTETAKNDARADLLLPALGASKDWKLGLVNYLQDDDGVARHYQLYKKLEGWHLLSMPIVVAHDLGFKMPSQSTLRVSWHGDGKNSPYQKWSYADLWQEIQEGKANGSFLNKIVFFGSTAAGLHDLRPTPLNSQYPMLYLLANTFDNIKNQQSLHYSGWLGIAFGLPVLLWLWWSLHRKKALKNIVLILAAAVLVQTGASIFAVRYLWLLPVVSTFIAALSLLGLGIALRYMDERKARQVALDLFGRFLDPIVVERLAQEGLSEETLKGQNCHITALFSDIRGFTTLSEKMHATDVMTLLNDYFGRQVGVIFKNQGTLDKFIGDAIMAFWGAPIADPGHARKAVAAALDMVDELERFRAERHLGDFDVGIGIHSGPAVVGMLGCDQRLEYTAIGDTVNVGSRLEGMTKGIARVLVSQSTRDACGDAFEFIPHGSCKLKGREEPVNVYEPRRIAS
ncbi:MAG: adenylate/guanylate cyclase domain-containing protein [Desulfosalsimonadaceae bacterium]|nr:adenylate/guanylate cyclase domain-containing protein [Desulfosalsimonadaceae bacterium]